MKKSIWFVVFAVLVSMLVLAACGGGGEEAKSASAAVPAEYANLTNPFAGQADAVTAGKDVYTQNCATCHGDTGKGDGPASAALDPKPADLVDDVAKNDSEQYIHWVISEGGAAAKLSTSMPAFKGVLTDDQLWQVTNYIKSMK